MRLAHPTLISARLPSQRRNLTECTIGFMTDSDSPSVRHQSPESATNPESRTQALNRIREAENERLVVERSIQKRLAWLGVVAGASVGMLVGYLATLITIVDSGIGEFGFEFYRPNFLQGFLRVVTAYLIGGGAVGGSLMYVLFTSRNEASSAFRWLIVAVVYALATPLLIGFLLPITILIFGDFVEGLRPGLWLSAFVETLLGSFLDGYIFLVKVLYAGVVGGLLFVAVTSSVYVASQRHYLPMTLTDAMPKPVFLYVVASSAALIPLVVIAFGPFSLTTAVASFLTGEKI